MSDPLAVSKLVTTKLMELRKWRYIAEGMIPLTDLYDEDGNLASVGLKYKVGKGDSYLDGGDGHNFARFYDGKRPVQMEVRFPNGDRVRGYITGTVGKHGVMLSGKIETTDGTALIEKASAVNPSSAVYYVWRAD